MDAPTPMLLKIGDVEARVKMGRSLIAKLEKRGLFPRRIKLSRAARWKTTDIEQWVAQLGIDG